MTKIIIPKSKRDEIESMIFALAGACIMLGVQEGRCTDAMIAMRDRVSKEIMDILDNK